MKLTTSSKNALKAQLNSLLNLIDKLENKLINSGTNLSEDQACKILEVKNEILRRWIANGIIRPDKNNQFKKTDIENLKKRLTK